MKPPLCHTRFIVWCVNATVTHILCAFIYRLILLALRCSNIEYCGISIIMYIAGIDWNIFVSEIHSLLSGSFMLRLTSNDTYDEADRFHFISFRFNTCFLCTSIVCHDNHEGNVLSSATAHTDAENHKIPRYSLKCQTVLEHMLRFNRFVHSQRKRDA